MINIKINLNSVQSSTDINAIAQEISSLMEQITGHNANVNINVRDDHSTSPLGIYKTQEYQKLRGRI